jgi:hypothetical protein
MTTKVIYKFNIEPDEQVIALPEGAEILTAQVQHGEPKLWALVEPSAKDEARYIWVIGTGWHKEIPEGRKLDYISTFQLREGRLIYHVFELVYDPIKETK